MRRRLDDLLLEEGLLDEAALRQARRHARRQGIALARAVVETRLLTDGALADMLVRRLCLPRADLSHEPVDADAVREVPHDFAEARRLLPLSIDRGANPRTIRVAMADPLDLDAVEELELSTGCDVDPLVAPVGELGEAIHRHYRGIITKMIPRKAAEGPTTKPNHQLLDEVGLDLQLRALVDVLAERGLVDRDAWIEAVRRLAKQKAGE